MKKIICLIGLLFFCHNVKANQVILMEDRIDDTYTYYYDSQLGRNRFLNASKYIFGDNVAYCLELGKKIESNIYTMSSSFDEINIDKEDIDYVKLVSYYGYDYPGHDSDRYYMATQELIWNRLSNVSIKWVKDLNPYSVVDVSFEKNVIISLINSHYIKPSFDGKEVDMIYGKDLVLTDTNNVLKYYETDNKYVKIDGDKLIIDGNIDTKEIILNKKNYSDRVFFVYSSGNSQKMLSSGKIDNVSSKIKLKIKSGSLTISKLDKETGDNVPQGDASLFGAIYEIFDENDILIGEIVIGRENTINNLPIGKYYIKEKEASDGYLLDDNVYEVEITENELNINLTVYEEVIKREINIFKVFASDKTGILVGESGVTFEIYDSKNKLVNTITTDSDGFAKVLLPYGIYTFRQVNSTEDYYKVDDFIVKVDKYDERPIYKLLSNSEIKARLRVVKKDIETGKNIINSNVKFKIFDIRNNDFVKFKLTYPKKEEIDVFSVDSDGIFVTPFELSSGEYILYEVDQEMNGYTYNNEGIRFSIGEDSDLINDNEYGVMIEIPFYNRRVRGNINIVKYGENMIVENFGYKYDKILLENVKFNIYALEDIYENGDLIYESGTLIGEVITDEKGVAKISNLPLGKYKIEEVSSSNGNVIENNEYVVSLSYIDQYTSIINYKLIVNNYLPKGSLTINKYEKDTEIGIPNTLIEICNIRNEVVYSGYTDNNGQIILDDLSYGEYYISEVEASSGYKILEDRIYFDIDSSEKTIDIYNERYVVPNTGVSGIYNIILIILIVFGMILVFVFNKIVVKILGFSFIAFGIGYYSLNFYLYFNDYYNNEKSVTAILNDEDEVSRNEKYDYIGFIEIPSIELKRGFLDKENKYNDVKYNIEIIDMSENGIIMAAHNGNSYYSYFDNLKKLELGDTIYIYYNNKKYVYIYSDYYEVEKTGYVDVYRDNTRKNIVLITCKDQNKQSVFVGYLKEVLDF